LAKTLQASKADKEQPAREKEHNNRNNQSLTNGRRQSAKRRRFLDNRVAENPAAWDGK
jgi:hypothetical protein